MMDIRDEQRTAKDIEAVITSYNQGDMIIEAVHSLCEQTVLPSRIIIVDDGSTDKHSLDILNTIKADPAIPIPVAVIQQANSGVSTARNTGIRMSETPLVLVLDGDDKVKPSYIEQVCKLLHENTSMVAASSNVKSMLKRLELMRFIIRKHNQSYQAHIEDAILGIETISMSRLDGWENEICNTLKEKKILSQASVDFIKSPSYGDGGMAAAVRIVSNCKK